MILYKWVYHVGFCKVSLVHSFMKWGSYHFMKEWSVVFEKLPSKQINLSDSSLSSIAYVRVQGRHFLLICLSLYISHPNPYSQYLLEYLNIRSWKSEVKFKTLFLFLISVQLKSSFDMLEILWRSYWVNNEVNSIICSITVLT